MITSLPIIVKGPVASVESKSNSADLNARGRACREGWPDGRQNEITLFLRLLQG